MNYSSAQTICLWLDEKYMPVDAGDNEGLYWITLFISSKGPFFTFRCQYLKNVTERRELKRLNLPHLGQFWFTFKTDEIPPQIWPHRERIEREMVSKNYILLSGSILWEEVEDKVTDMDGIPATLFDVLFSELH